MILVTNKIDCLVSAPISAKPPQPEGNYFKKHVLTCAVTGQGVEELEEAILEVIGVEPIPSGGRKWAANQVGGQMFLFLETGCAAIDPLHGFNIIGG